MLDLTRDVPQDDKLPGIFAPLDFDLNCRQIQENGERCEGTHSAAFDVDVVPLRIAKVCLCIHRVYE